MTPLRSVTSENWPAPDSDTTEPVMILLHGYGSHEHDLAGLAPLLPPKLPWASLRAPLDMGDGAAAWFALDTGLGFSPTAVTHATEALWSWIDLNAPADAPLIPLGFSQGGCMALQMLRTRPERLLATVVLAGFASPGEQPADARLETAPPAVFWGRGTMDQVIPGTLISSTRQWLAKHADVRAEVYPDVAHGINEQVMMDVRAFLEHHLQALP